MFLKLKKYSSGQSLLEIVIALGVFSLLAASIGSLILGSLALSSEGGKIFKANLLAQEGLEAVRSIKDRAWNELVFNRSAVSSLGGTWQFVGEGTTEGIGDFIRTIDFLPVYRNAQNNIVASTSTGAWADPQTKEVRVRVSWENARNKTSSVFRDIYLTNWDSYVWAQADWSGGAGQDLYAINNKYYADDGNINAETSGQLSLKEISTSTFALEGYVVSSAYNIGTDSAPSIVFADWEAPDECGGCEVKIQIKSAPDAGGAPGAWTLWSGEDGVDGDETDYYIATSTGVIINSDHNGDQWFRYKAILTGNGGSAPVLEEIRFDYKR